MIVTITLNPNATRLPALSFGSLLALFIAEGSKIAMPIPNVAISTNTEYIMFFAALTAFVALLSLDIYFLLSLLRNL